MEVAVIKHIEEISARLEHEPVNRLGFVPELDGVRGLAIIAVMSTHLMNWLFPGGALGVDLFFVLSGYLITSLLVKEWSDTDRIDLRAFWMRRILRLLPALSVYVVAAAAGAVIVGESVRTAGLAAVFSVFYLGNIVRAAGLAFPPSMNHLWSLAIEEQFYLVWPMVFVLIRRRATRRASLIIGVVVSIVVFTAWRTVLWAAGAGETRLRIAPDTRADVLLFGCLVGLLMSWNLLPRLLDTRPVRLALWPAAVFMIVFLFIGGRNGRPVWAYTAIGVASVVLLLNVLNPERVRVRAFMRWRPLVFLGSISYALYLWHLFVLVVAERVLSTTNTLILTVVAVPLSICIAVLSGVIIERPFRQMRNRYAPKSRVIGVPLPRS
ncbi:MAG: acyltransferase [Ilumatobacteraceae bacterium]